MQGLTDGPRSTLTAAAVSALLVDSPDLMVTAGLELLDFATLALLEDMTDDFEDGTVERVMLADIHGTCKLRIARELPWGNVLVRPYQVLKSGPTTARFNLGIFALATPVRTAGPSVRTYEVTGYDRLYLLNRPIGDTYSIPAGTPYLVAIATTLEAAGILAGTYSLQGDAGTVTLPSARTWPFFEGGEGTGTVTQTTWLRVVNDLLAAVGYRSAYADPSTGVIKGEPYRNPLVRSSEFTFGASGSRAIVSADRTETVDLYSAPNRWRFVQQNRVVGSTPVDGAGIYTVTNQSQGPTSVDARGGLVWPVTVTLDAADQASLMAQGDIRVAADMRTSRTFDISTSPLPIAGHFDVITLDDPELGALVKCQAQRWELPLSGGDVRWTLEAVV